MNTIDFWAGMAFKYFQFLHEQSYSFAGDQKLIDFLGDEISVEKKNAPQKVGKVEGWDVKTDGTGVILSRKFNDEM